jgi:hypothetical protein
MDCNADIILGYDWLRAHDLAFIHEEDQVCLCAERGCASGRRVRLDLALAGPSSSASRLTAMEARALRGAMGFGPVDIQGRPSRRCPPAGRPSLVAALAAAAEAAWTTDTFAGLADAGTTLDKGTDLFIGSISFAVDGPAFVLPAEDGEPPDTAALIAEYGDVLASPPPGLPPDRGPEFELCIDNGPHPMPRSRPMKRWSQGELDEPECRKQVAFMLDQGWIIPSRASHAASVVFARKPDGTWRFCQDYRGLNAILQRSVEPLPHANQLLDETRGARSFTKLDLASAYWQFRIRPEDQFKTFFRVPRTPSSAARPLSSTPPAAWRRLRPPRQVLPRLCSGASSRSTATTSSSSPRRAKSSSCTC